MLTTRALPFLPGRRALRRYSADLAARIAAEPAVRLLEGLLTLPLGAEPLPDPAATLALRSSVALLGPPAGGRSLALLQTAARWAEGDGDAPVLYLPLAHGDAPNLSPRAIVAGATHRASLPAAFADGGRPGLLLVDDWELLSADRRALWESYLTAGAAQWPALRAVVALPPGAAWPGLAPVAVAPPSDEGLGPWLAHLLPQQDCAPILAALAHEPLASLRGSLADLVLLALVYPLSGLPSSRAQLYEQAYALVRPLIEELPGAPAPAVADEGPTLSLGPASSVLIGRALLRHYRLARALAGGDDLESLAERFADERAAVAPLAAGLLDDPRPVLESLWAADDDPASLRALAACARETPGRAPLFGLRLVERLAAPDAPPDAPALLAGLAPALPALLAAAGRADEPRAVAAVPALAAAMPGAHAMWLRLCDDLEAPAALRWASADILAAALPPADVVAYPPPGAPPQALAPRVYLAAVGGPEGRAALAGGPLRDSLLALFLAPRAGERRAAAARALILDPEVPEAMRALALGHAGSDEAVERAAGSPSPALRRAALAALAAGEPGEALASLGRALAQPEASPRARQETLDTIAGLPHPAATAALTRAALAGALTMTARLRAVDLLAGRGPEGAHLLRRLLATAGLPVALRCAAAGHLGRLGVGEALPALAAILAAPGEPLLRRVAATALGALAQRPDLRPRATAALLAGLRRAAADTAVGERIARALGNSGHPAALPALAGLTAPGLAEALRGSWLRLAPVLERTPAFAWPGLELPAHVHLALVDALADGGTLADPPSRLAELAARQAARLAMAAADGLADLAAAPELRAGALAALRRAAHGEARADVARAALAALARVGDRAAELGALFDDPAAGPSLRWLAVEALGAGPRALDLLRRRLERGGDDPFVMAMVVDALGAGMYAPALPALRHIARAPASDPHLRRRAVAALGRLDHPEAAVALAALAADQGAPAELRAAAAAALPPLLDAGERQALRQALRADSEAGGQRLRLPADLAAAIARALARAGEAEALAPLVRSAQSDAGADAAASIEALAALGDQSVAPILVRVSQSPMAAPGVKLAAVAALLRLGGAEYEPLLREYLAAPSPPLRIQAHAALAAAFPDDPRLAEPLVDPAAPLALRLQALGHLAARGPDAPVIAAVVAAPDEQPQLRLAAAALLARATHAGAAVALAAPLAPPVIDADPPSPVLRRRCAQSLGALARADGPAAEEARDRLATIANDPDQPAAHRHWAAEALLAC